MLGGGHVGRVGHVGSEGSFHGAFADGARGAYAPGAGRIRRQSA